MPAVVARMVVPPYEMDWSIPQYWEAGDVVVMGLMDIVINILVNKVKCILTVGSNFQYICYYWLLLKNTSISGRSTRIERDMQNLPQVISPFISSFTVMGSKETAMECLLIIPVPKRLSVTVGTRLLG